MVFTVVLGVRVVFTVVSGRSRFRTSQTHMLLILSEVAENI